MSRARTAALVVAVLLIALNLRPAVVAVSPLVGQIRADLHIGSAVAGLVTTLPVLCFGLLAPVAGRLSRRWGLESTLLVALLVLTAGILVRLVPTLATLLAGSVLAGMAIATGNTLMPVVVKRDFPRHTGPMTGAYSVMLSGGGAIAAAVMVPVEHATGLGWRSTLGLWAVLAALGLVLWLPWTVRARRQRAADADPPAGRAVGGLWRSPLAWQVTLLMGLQSLQFYALTAWVPTLFVDAGRTASEAGLLLGLTGVCGVVTSYVTPVLATRRRTQHHLVAALVVLWAVGLVGLLLAPSSLAVLWMVLLGLGQGVGISLALTLITLRAPDAEHTAELSGMAQGVGYVIAALGPLGLGALHDATGSWTVPLIVLIVLLVPMGVAGIGAARDRHVRRAAPPLTSPPASPPAGDATQDAEDAAPGPTATPTLRGRVRSGRAPLPGATVTLVDDHGRQVGRADTDAEGAFVLDGAGSGLVICAAPHHRPTAWRPVPGRPADVELEPAGEEASTGVWT